MARPELAAPFGEGAEAALRALAHPCRRRMLKLVWDAERCSGELATACGLSKPAASQHLKLLREAELVEVRVEANRRWYRARAERLAAVRALLDDFWGDRLEALQSALTTPEPP